MLEFCSFLTILPLIAYVSCTKIAIWNNFFYPELFHFFYYFSFKINKLLILEQLELLEQRFLCVYTCFLI
ncbi:hypothetical protein DUG25_20940 [Salmonella enterica]|nr:hypothetical protein CS348_17415 [Salmonella enterica subsp. enterica serovar Gaminara]EAU3240474.1 hypothetical protein [Salmonella enterica]EBS2393408.1 hypothetical protein [Salmonella enterica subsp. enterica serovar Arechavaleta]ECS6191739.1 hypothetical protein [Salmonella enterica subsp. enterica serovar Enteritidis]EAU6333615.1 hypothetical protein [Salmonella enterica]